MSKVLNKGRWVLNSEIKVSFFIELVKTIMQLKLGANILDIILF